MRSKKKKVQSQFLILIEQILYKTTKLILPTSIILYQFRPSEKKLRGPGIQYLCLLKNSENVSYPL